MPEELIELRGEEFDESMGCEPMLLFWYANEGEAVVEGQDLCEIESAKAVTVVTAPADGVLAEVLVKESEPVGSGQLLARLRVIVA
jgi:pyruvate/2-oxoglutarate dehydrogenase complex dihydrolipoamide acyltransferase (E2) component